MRVLLRAAADEREAGEAPAVTGSSLYAPRVHKDQREEERSTLGAQSDLRVYVRRLEPPYGCGDSTLSHSASGARPHASGW